MCKLTCYGSLGPPCVISLLHIAYLDANFEMGMFENDRDREITLVLENGHDVDLLRLVHQTDMLTPPEAKKFYKTEEYAEILKVELKEARHQLDQGLCRKLFKNYRSKVEEVDVCGDGKYKVIVLAALMMRIGARIAVEDMEYIRRILPDIPSRNGYHPPLRDAGFRDPGKAQFTAAVENYESGTPRDFGAPR